MDTSKGDPEAGEWLTIELNLAKAIPGEVRLGGGMSGAAHSIAKRYRRSKDLLFMPLSIVSRIVSPILSPIVAPILSQPVPAQSGPTTVPTATPTPSAAPTPAPVPSPVPAAAAPAPAASQPMAASPAQSGPSAPAAPRPNPAYSGVENAVGPRSDRSRVSRQDTADVALLSAAVADLARTEAAEQSGTIEASAIGNDIEVGILVARTRADIIANASQALRAQASVNSQTVAELLEA